MFTFGDGVWASNGPSSIYICVWIFNQFSDLVLHTNVWKIVMNFPFVVSKYKYTRTHVGPNIPLNRPNDLLPIERDILNLTISQQQYTKCDSWTTYCSGFEHYDKTEHVNTFQRLTLSRHTNYIADLYSSGFGHEMNFIHFLFRALIVFSEEKCVKKTLCLDENMQIKKFHIFNAFLVQSSPLQLTQRLTSCIKVNKPIKSQIHSSNANHLFSR